MNAGIILLDKEQGLSSAQAIAQVKRRLSLKKIGHSGTLDPMATGLLVCLCGSATRLAPYALNGQKVYSGEILLGLTTDSDDITGAEISRSQAVPGWQEIESSAMGFVGKIEQRPPHVSAVKVNGKRAYAIARDGGVPEVSSREVELHSLEIKPVDEMRVSFRLKCSKGFYVRSLARDLGEALGCGGVLSALRREASLPFSIENARKVNEISKEHILPVENLFPGRPSLELDSREAGLLLRGDSKMLYSLSAELNRIAADSEVLFFDRSTGKACGLLLRVEGSWKFGVNIVQGD